MEYKVQIGFITSDNEVIKPGIYKSSDIDLAEARKKSIVTAVNANNFIASSPNPDDTIEVKQFYSQPQDIDTKIIQPTIEIKKINAIKINSADIKEIESIKFVGKKTAEAVIKNREDKPFANYIDLDTRVPLRGNRKWQDIAALDFEFKFKTTLMNTVEFR